MEVVEVSLYSARWCFALIGIRMGQSCGAGDHLRCSRREREGDD